MKSISMLPNFVITISLNFQVPMAFKNLDLEVLLIPVTLAADAFYKSVIRHFMLPLPGRRKPFLSFT